MNERRAALPLRVVAGDGWASGTPTAEVYRIDWLPGTDVLHGVCHCGAEHTAEDPVELWQWMLAHPSGHHPAGHHPAGHRPSGHHSAGPAEHQPTGHREEPRP